LLLLVVGAAVQGLIEPVVVVAPAAIEQQL
jgi:hypothetical protein